MVAPVTTRRLIIQLGNGATPTELFGYPCGVNSYTVSMTNNLGEETLIDCDTPLDTPAAILRYLETQDTQVQMQGQLDRTHLAVWRTWSDGAVIRNIRIRIDETGAAGGGYWQLPAIMSAFELVKENSGIVTISATLMGAGQRVWTAAT